LIRIIKIATILFQVGLTLIVTFILYMIFAIFDYKGGVANFVGLTLFQPLLAILMSVLTIIICGLAGLPIRLNKRLNNWWRKHFYISILLGLVGVIACGTSLMPGFVQEVTYRMDVDMARMVPNRILSITGWFLVAIGTLHSYLPQRLLDKFERLVNPKIS